jgi:hypothetical protein
MTIDMDAIKARRDAATPGPWCADPIEDDDVDWFVHAAREPDFPILVQRACGEADAEFIAHARQDVDDLVAEVEQLRREDTRLRGVIADELVRDGQVIEADHREMVGYVLVDPNTNAMDWDGLIHDTRDGAIKEAVGALNLDDGDKQRPCCGADLWYEVGEVRRPGGLNEAVLAAAQAEWDRHRAEFLNG